MPDEAALESNVGAKDPVKIEVSKSPWRFLRNISKRFKKHTGNPNPNSEVNKTENLEVPAVEQLNIIPAPEHLRPADAVFFHTTRSDNLLPIREHGLYSDKKDPNISNRLGYSLFFAFEHAISRHDQDANRYAPVVRIVTPNNYILTVWQSGKEFKKAKYGWATDGLIDVVGEPEEEVPIEFLRASPVGLYLKREELGRSRPESFLAAIPLNKDIRDEILKSMVLAAKGKITADEIESNLLNRLNQENIVLNNIETIDLAHSITTSIERDLIRYVVIPAVNQVQKSPEIRVNKMSEEYQGKLLNALWLTMLYGPNVNDTTTVYYFRTTAQRLINRMKMQKVNVRAILHQLQEKLSLVRQVPHSEFSEKAFYSPNTSIFYGGSWVCVEAAASMERELGFK